MKLIIFFLLLGIIVFQFNQSIDCQIERKDTMLCDSAKISGNSDYLSKCDCYYKSGDIECLQVVE